MCWNQNLFTQANVLSLIFQRANESCVRLNLFIIQTIKSYIRGKQNVPTSFLDNEQNIHHVYSHK